MNIIIYLSKFSKFDPIDGIFQYPDFSASIQDLRNKLTPQSSIDEIFQCQDVLKASIAGIGGSPVLFYIYPFSFPFQRFSLYCGDFYHDAGSC